MAEAVAGPLDQHHFAIRRLHSLMGIVPIGAFLFNHLLTNSTAFLGEKNFDDHVLWIHHMPWLLAIEVCFIFVPIAFHAVYGVVIALQARSNVSRYGYGDNWRYMLQRVTAWITLVFIVVHLVHFRFAHWFGAESYAAAHPYFLAFTQQGFTMWLPMSAWMVIYVIGLAAAVFHLCNGLVTFCITWGVVIGDDSRKRLSLAAAALGLLLMAWGLISLYALGTMEARGPGGAEPAHVAQHEHLS